MIDFGQVLDEVGSFGTYQIIVFLSLCYYGIPCGINSVAPVFIAYTPDYRCYVYPFDDSTLFPNLTAEAIGNLTTPLHGEGKGRNSCVRYGYNVSECIDGTDFSCVDKSAEVIPCDQGIYYGDRIFTETVVTEFDMVCEQRILKSVYGATFMAGLIFGAPLYGAISDRYGRKLCLVTSCFGMLLCMLATAFVRSVELFIAAQFLIAIFTEGCNVSIFCHIMEIVGPNRRTLVGVGYQVAFAMGYMLWSCVAYNWRDWHQMQFASFVLSAPLMIIVLFVPESPRWLFSSGKEERGKEVVATMAKLNKVKIDEQFWREMKKATKAELNDDQASIIDLFRYPGLRILTLKVGFIWAVNGMVYYGITLNAGSLAGDIFINNVLAGLLEIISYVTCALTMDYVGRRLLLSVTLTGSGIGLLVSTIVNEYADGNSDLATAGVVLALIAKALVAASLCVTYNFTTELYPTVLRGNGVGFGAMSAPIGSFLSPFIIGIQDYVTWVPNTIFGAIGVIGGLLALTFRDTTGKPMMETIEEAELFHTGKKIKGSKTSVYM